GRVAARERGRWTLGHAARGAGSDIDANGRPPAPGVDSGPAGAARGDRAATRGRSRIGARSSRTEYAAGGTGAGTRHRATGGKGRGGSCHAARTPRARRFI